MDLDLPATQPWWIAPAAPLATDFDGFRATFPAATRSTYTNTCSIGIMSRAAADRAKHTIEAICLGAFSKEDAAPVLGSAKAGLAGLLNIAQDEVGIVKNVSDGLNALATAVPRACGDNVVVCTEMEHPNNIYLWQKMARDGVEIRDVPAEPDGSIPVAAMVEAIDARTRIITASSVTFTPGFRADLSSIGRAARAHDAFFLVDAVQSCGVVDHDLGAEKIDGLVTSTTKNLLGSAGLGFVAVGRDWIDRLEPIYVSRYGVERGSGHESEIEGDDFAYAQGATRFDVGNHNWPAISAAEVSIEAIGALGTARIEAHAVALADGLREGFDALGLPVNHPADKAMRTHMVTLGARGAGGAYATADARLNTLADALVAANVRFSIRRGLLRFGLHGFNAAADVSHILDVAAGVRGG